LGQCGQWCNRWVACRLWRGGVPAVCEGELQSRQCAPHSIAWQGG
jgi:hypothetical protein